MSLQCQAGVVSDNEDYFYLWYYCVIVETDCHVSRDCFWQNLSKWPSHIKETWHPPRLEDSLEFCSSGRKEHCHRPIVSSLVKTILINCSADPQPGSIQFDLINKNTNRPYGHILHEKLFLEGCWVCFFRKGSLSFPLICYEEVTLSGWLGLII